jgi:hypothetical protein
MTRCPTGGPPPPPNNKRRPTSPPPSPAPASPCPAQFRSAPTAAGNTTAPAAATRPAPTPLHPVDPPNRRQNHPHQPHRRKTRRLPARVRQRPPLRTTHRPTRNPHPPSHLDRPPSRPLNPQPGIRNSQCHPQFSTSTGVAPKSNEPVFTSKSAIAAPQPDYFKALRCRRRLMLDTGRRHIATITPKTCLVKESKESSP